jgi:hypothetical protein
MTATKTEIPLPENELVSKLVLLLAHFLADRGVAVTASARGTLGLYREVPTAAGPHPQVLCWIEPDKKGRLILGYDSRTPASLRAALEPWVQQLVSERGGTEKHEGDGFTARWPLPLKVAPADVAEWLRQALDRVDAAVGEHGGAVEAPSGPVPIERAPRARGEASSRPKSNDGSARAASARKPPTPELSAEALASLRKGEKCPGCSRVIIDEKAHRRCLTA